MRTLLTALLLALPISAWSAAFQFTPVRISFPANDPIQTLRITNQSEHTAILQFDMLAWSQDTHGEDHYTESQAIVVTPAIVNIPPNATQVVRLGIVVPPSLSREGTYRLRAREVVNQIPQRKDTVQFALEFLLPVFLQPAAYNDKPHPLPQLRFIKGKPYLYLHNREPAHYLVTKLVASDLKMQQTVTRRLHEYLLPGAQKYIPLDLPFVVKEGTQLNVEAER